ncbi:MAG: hypothetical protein AAFN13_19155, partial [Bacteroidota bacterium]
MKSEGRKVGPANDRDTKDRKNSGIVSETVDAARIAPHLFDLRPSTFDLRPSTFDLRPSTFTPRLPVRLIAPLLVLALLAALMAGCRDEVPPPP